MGTDLGWLKVIEERGLLAPSEGVSPRGPASAVVKENFTTAPVYPWAVEFVVPIRPINESNRGGSLRGKLARKAAIKSATGAAIPPALALVPLPAMATLTRIGGQKRMDDDGLGTALKYVRDRIAAALRVDDGDTGRVRFRCRQRPGYGAARVLVRVETSWKGR